MFSRKITYTILICLAALVLILYSIINFERNDTLKVIFLDVGQGDAVLISQGSNQILIDGGKDGKMLLAKLGKWLPFWDRTIETVIETHPDADHIGGLVDVFRAYQVETVFKTQMSSDSQTFKALENAVANEKTQVLNAKLADTLMFPSGAEMKILFPFDSQAAKNKETNAASVTAKLSFGENSFLFTGDLPIEQENEILAKGIDVNADVLKVGHHGSKYSSADNFLDAVHPQDAIISVGKNNTYGHPNQDVLQKLLVRKIDVYRTDEMGDIAYACEDAHSQCELELAK